MSKSKAIQPLCLCLRYTFICILGVLPAGCRHHSQSSTPLPPVTVAHPAVKPVTENLDLTGTVAASLSVNLVARVAGYLESVNFKDGDYVGKDQLLFVIEPKPYEEQVALNEAGLVQAQAEYDRQVGLSKQNATAASSLEKQLSLRDQAKSQVDLAKINLGYTRVTAPFAGRIGRRQVDPGNLVGVGSATVIAKLDQMIPIYVNFNLNERDALHLREMMQKAGMAPKSNVGKAPVFVGLNNETDYPHQGVLDFADNEISSSTGTIALRAVFENSDKALFPGLFARVRIPLGPPQQMLVIPNSSIGNDQQGDYVFVVDANDEVARRSVVKGPLTPDGCAIRAGLTVEDRVVVNGLLNARPGSKVQPLEPSTATPPPKS
jgi:RND family efflux transporter MFP subunit